MRVDCRVIGVFGANGFIGRAIVRRLAGEHRRVVAFGRTFPVNYKSIVSPNIEVREVDLTDVLGVHAAIHDITDVVQLINSSSPSLGNTRAVDDLRANIAPHVAFIESCLMNKMKSYVFVSSGGTVYGEPMYTPIDEAHPTRPINSYGLTKMVVEHYLRMLSHGTAMRALSLRVSNPFGPGQTLKKGQGLVASILENEAQGLPTTIFGDGSAVRDYLFIDDLVDAVVRALDGSTRNAEINIGSGVRRSILDVVDAVERALGRKLQVQYTASRPTDAMTNVLCCTKAFDMLGWQAHTDFDEAIRRTVAASPNLVRSETLKIRA